VFGRTKATLQLSLIKAVSVIEAHLRGTSNCVYLHAGGVVELFKMRGRAAINCGFKKLSALPAHKYSNF